MNLQIRGGSITGLRKHDCLLAVTFSIPGLSIKFANLILEELFIMTLYQLDKQSTKFLCGSTGKAA